MKTLFKVIVISLIFSASVNAESFNPYNQQFTYNQQYGSTNWYSSPLGMGVAQAGVTLIGGLVNALSRPSTPVVQQQQQPVYVNGGQGYPQQYPQQGYYPQPGYYPQMGHNGLYNAYGQPIQ